MRIEMLFKHHKIAVLHMRECDECWNKYCNQISKVVRHEWT